MKKKTNSWHVFVFYVKILTVFNISRQKSIILDGFYQNREQNKYELLFYVKHFCFLYFLLMKVLFHTASLYLVLLLLIPGPR